MGLEQAARDAVQHRARDIVWEEEDAEGTIEPSDETAVAQEDDSWLETQSDSIIVTTQEDVSLSGLDLEDIAETPQPEEVPTTEESDEPPTQAMSEEATMPDTPSEPDEPPRTDLPESEDKPNPPEPQYEIEEQHVHNLAASLRNAGAKLFFHVDDEPDESTDEPAVEDAESPVDEPDESTNEPAVQDELAVEDAEPPVDEPDEPDEPDELDELDEPMEAPAVQDESAGEVAEATGFDARFDKYLGGRLDNDSVLELITDGLQRNMLDEVRELLHFEPHNDYEETARKQRLVDYYMAVDRPSTALELIETLDLKALDSNDTRAVLTKKAVCQKLINDFEGANDTYLKIKREFPSPEADKMAKQNYERYLEDQCGKALVLEKTTSLHDD